MNRPQLSYVGGLGALAIAIVLMIGLGSQRTARHPRPAPGTELAWLSDEGEARRLASQKRLPILIDFTASWCEACHELEHSVFEAPEFLERRGKFIPLRLDLSAESRENDVIMRNYRIQGLPTVLFIDREGRTRQEARVEGAGPLEEYLKIIDSL